MQYYQVGLDELSRLNRGTSSRTNRSSEPSPIPRPTPTGGLVYLVDDEPSVRRALSNLLRAASLEVVSFATAQDFLAAANSNAGPACVIADLSMPGMGGLELQELMRERGLNLPIIFISGRADVRSGVQAMRGGAVDFLEKPLLMQHLGPAIERAFEHDRGRRALLADRTALEARAERLTPREREVFVLVAKGLANKVVGAELGATEKTIKVHRARVMEKMEASSLAELVRMADKLALGATPPDGGRDQ